MRRICWRGPEEKIDREQRGSDCKGVQTYREAVSMSRCATSKPVRVELVPDAEICPRGPEEEIGQETLGLGFMREAFDEGSLL
jgi:hypothetical protein